MTKKYYSEELEKDARYRQEYEESLVSFLEDERKAAAKRRLLYAHTNNYKAHQELYRQDFIKMLGFPLDREREIPTLKEQALVAKDENVNIYRMQFCFWGKIQVYAMYFEQQDMNAGTPFVVGLHGGDGTPELVSSIHMNSANYNHMVRRMTDKGANVLVPQLLLWNKENYGGSYDRILIDGKMRQLGGSITALEIYFLRGLIDYFISKQKVNLDKIGVCGMSYGGMYALHLAAVDTRIKACYSCSWVCDGFTYSWADWSYKDAQNTFSVAETAGLIAPRALVVAMGDKDELFDCDLTRLECERIQEFYNAFQSNDHFMFEIFHGVHEFDKENNGFDFFFSKIQEGLYKNI